MTADRPAAPTRAVLVAALLLVLTACQRGSVTSTSPADDGAAVRDLLSARASAVLSGDRAALATTAGPGASASVTAFGSRVAGLRFTTWEYTVQALAGGDAAGTVAARVLLRYRLAADPAGGPPASALRSIVLAGAPGRPGGLGMVSDVPLGAALPWDLAAVVGTGSGSATVLDVGGAASSDGATAGLLADATRAATAVTAVWGTGWRRAPVVVATRGGAALAALTGRDPSGLVAVSTSDRVYVDVRSWSALSPAGRQVLLTHEVTHLATGSATDPDVPLWLVEGFADYVGFLGSGIDVRTAAASLLDPVRAGRRPPVALPADADFAAGGTRAAQAYAGAWLACRLVAATVGTPGLVAVYRGTSAGRAGPGADVDAALRRLTGSGTAAWTARWRTYVLRESALPGPGTVAP